MTLGYTSTEIRDFLYQRGLIRDDGAAINPRVIYDYAQQYKVTGPELDAAMGWRMGDADNWVRENGLPPLNFDANQPFIAPIPAPAVTVPVLPRETLPSNSSTNVSPPYPQYSQFDDPFPPLPIVSSSTTPEIAGVSSDGLSNTALLFLATAAAFLLT